MKKIFLFAAAILASVSLMAVDPTYESAEWNAQKDAEEATGEHNGVTITNAGLSYGNLGSNGKFYYMAAGSNLKATDGTWKYFGVDAGSGNAIDSISIYYCENGSNETNIAWAAWGADETPSATISMYGETAGTKGAKKLDNAKWVTIDLHALEAQTVYLNRSIREFKNGEGTKIDNFGKSQTFNILGFKVWTRVLVVKTDPVAVVTVDGPTEAYVGSKISLKASFDAKPDTIWWTDKFGVDLKCSSATLDFTPEAAGSYTFVAWAQNKYNVSPANSEVFTVVATEKTELVQVDVTASTTWDWTKAATVNTIEFTGKDGFPAKDVDTVVLANVEGMVNDANFNSQALLFAGQYAVRDGKYIQGPYLSFNTTVAGWIQVDFSNTGAKDDPRYVKVNGVVNTTVGSKTTDKVQSARIAVPAGKVEIQGAFEDGTVQYLRIYKVVFSTDDITTAIDNANAEVKAVKVVRDGQLLIKKGDVFFNAQGAVVK